jgi:hypothetical protein
MFLRVTRTRTDTARFDQVMSLSQEVIDAVKKQPGLKNVYMAGDASSGNGVIVTVWDTKQHAQFDRAVLGDIVSRAQGLGAQIEAPEIYEISAQG